ncbi:unnamed protein product [Musa hybrid cultivar]
MVIQLHEAFKVFKWERFRVLPPQFTQCWAFVEQAPQPVWVLRIGHYLRISTILEDIGSNDCCAPFTSWLISEALGASLAPPFGPFFPLPLAIANPLTPYLDFEHRWYFQVQPNRQGETNLCIECRRNPKP